MEFETVVYTEVHTITTDYNYNIPSFIALYLYLCITQRRYHIASR